MAFIPDENQNQEAKVNPDTQIGGGSFIPDPEQSSGPSPEATARVAAYETAPMLTDVGVRDFMPETSIPEQVLASVMGVTTFDPYSDRHRRCASIIWR